MTMSCRAVWRQAEANGSIRGSVRLLLLTAQRKNKVASMRWEDIEGTTGESGLRRGRRATLTLALPQVAIDIINAQPRFAVTLRLRWTWSVHPLSALQLPRRIS